MNRGSTIYFLISGLFIALLVFGTGCSGGSDSGEACEEGSTAEECTAKEEDPGESVLTCMDDEDCDGIFDWNDAYSTIACGSEAHPVGSCFTVEADADQDGHYDAACKTDEYELELGNMFCDNCIGISNPEQEDTNGDGNGCDELVVTECDDRGGDSDGDAICDDVDNCPDDYNVNDTDSDEDGVNDSQADVDGDGVGDSCDAENNNDEDGDGYTVAEGDCNDEDDTINPGADASNETIGGDDKDCDGSTGDVNEAIFVDGSIYYDCTQYEGSKGECGTYNNPMTNYDDALETASDQGKVLYFYEGTYLLDNIDEDDGPIELKIDEAVDHNGGLYCIDENGDPIVSYECASENNLRREEGRKTTFKSDDNQSLYIKITEDAVLDGFEFSELKTSAYPPRSIIIDDASPIIKNSIVDAKSALDAIEIRADSKEISPVIENSDITAYRYGIVLYPGNGQHMTPTIKGNKIVAGVSGIYGVNNKESAIAPIIEANTINITLDSTSEIYGIYINTVEVIASSLQNKYIIQILGNTIEVENSSSGHAYGVKLLYTSGYVERNNIIATSYSGSSVGIDIKYPNSHQLDVTSRIYNNISKARFGLLIYNSDSDIFNNTLIVSEASGYGIYFRDVANDGYYSVRIINNIFAPSTSSETWSISINRSEVETVLRNNLFSNGPGALFVNGTVQDTNILNLGSSMDNITAVNNYQESDLDLDGDDYVPDDDSPAVDKGYDVSAEVGDKDVDGDARVVGASIDIGAQECQDN